jgi:hypothetical protein
VKVLEDGSRGTGQDASGCSREEEAEEEVVVAVEEEEEMVEMVVAMVAVGTTGVETMVGVMTGVGTKGVKAGKTEEYDKERKQIHENRKSKEKSLNRRTQKEKRKNIPHPQNSKHNSHVASSINDFRAQFLIVNLQ